MFAAVCAHCLLVWGGVLVVVLLMTVAGPTAPVGRVYLHVCVGYCSRAVAGMGLLPLQSGLLLHDRGGRRSPPLATEVGTLRVAMLTVFHVGG